MSAASTRRDLVALNQLRAPYLGRMTAAQIAALTPANYPTGTSVVCTDGVNVETTFRKQGTIFAIDGNMVAVGIYATLAALQTAKPAASFAGAIALVGAAAPYAQLGSNGTSWVSIDGAGSVQAEVTGTTPLAATAFNAITPYNSAAAGVLTLPPAAAAWATKPFGIVMVPIMAAGIPTFTPAGSDTYVGTAGVPVGVTNGYIAAQIRSATKWVSI